MNEPPGVTSLLGIEGVEWVADGGENLTVRVTGRWRRRRPAWSAQPTLVIEGRGRRYRFPAIAEPPSLTGTGPGMWRISFAIPTALAPDLGGRAWLQFGAVIVPLPAAAGVVPGGLEQPPPEPSPGVPAAGASEAPVADIGTPAPPPEPPAQELDPRVRALEEQLNQARGRAERLAAELADSQLARRAAEQGARAERTLRIDLGRQLAAAREELERGREAQAYLAAAEAQLAAAQARVHELELALAQAHGQIAEVEQELERRAPPAAPEAPEEHIRLDLEQELIARNLTGRSRIPDEPAAPALMVPTAPAAGGPAAPARALTAAGTESALASLREELETRSRNEATLRARLVEAEARLAAREVLDGRTATVLSHLRRELDGLRADVAREQAARQAAEAQAAQLQSALGGARSRSQAAYAAIAELRDTVEALRNPAPVESGGLSGPGAEGGQTGSPVEAERLSEALTRLREQINPERSPPEAAPRSTPDPPSHGEPELRSAGHRWLRSVFRSLAQSELDLAGRLVVDLLPAQAAAFSAPVAYDLVLGGDLGCLRVTSRDGTARVTRSQSPRNPREVDFSLTGDPASLGRLLAAGPLRRLWRRGLARVRGRRAGVAALQALIDTDLGFGALHRAGVRLAPRTVLGVVACLIRPEWLSGESFCLAYEVPDQPLVYLVIGGHWPVEVTETLAPMRMTTTVSGPAGTLELLLSGTSPSPGVLAGEEWPLESLRRWIDRAQSG